MKIEALVVGSFSCNCFVLEDEDSQEAIIIDPGDEPEKIISYVQKRGVKVKALIHTHAHLDHMMATKLVKQETGAETFLHPGDNYLWENLKMQGDLFGIPVDQPGAVDRSLEDEMEISWAGPKLKTLFTPGHTPGSCCFVLEDSDPLVFSGDTLFKDSIGRTDLWGGDSRQILKSIKNRLYVLDDDISVLCGHGPETLIGHEKLNNPFCTV